MQAAAASCPGRFKGVAVSVLIVGGGASGVLLATQLLRHPSPGLRVILIEKRERLGRGLAYSAQQRDHLLNVPAPGMSAYPDDPEHFWRWLRQRGLLGEAERFVFMPRRLYGDYLAEVLAEADAARPGRLQVVQGECVALAPTENGVEARLADGRRLVAAIGVLAVGHENRPADDQGIAVPLGSPADTPLPRDAPVMLLGSGLSMVDAWLALEDAGHQGPVEVVSRHALLPRRHAEVPPLALAEDEVPFGAALRPFVAWFRALVRRTEAAGGDWRQAVDALRPHSQRIWQAWSSAARRGFLRHIRPYWNVHRHRLPPELDDRLQAALARGQLTLVAGTCLAIERRGHGVRALVRRRGDSAVTAFEVARVYDCGGVSVDVTRSSNPVVRSLLEAGHISPDPLRIGLEVAPDCRVVGRDGRVSDRLYAVGPVTRGTFFEIEAVPDIRLQGAELAGRLLKP